MTDDPATPHMTVCSWCDRVLNEGATPISHGICDDCLPRLLQTVLRTEATSLERSSRSHGVAVEI